MHISALSYNLLNVLPPFSGIRATRTGLNVVDNITVHLIHILQETMGTNEEFL